MRRNGSLTFRHSLNEDLHEDTLGTICFDYDSNNKPTIGHLVDGNNPVHVINIEGKLCNNVQIIANTINNYFSAPLPQMQSNTSFNVLDS